MSQEPIEPRPEIARRQPVAANGQVGPRGSAGASYTHAKRRARRARDCLHLRHSSPRRALAQLPQHKSRRLDHGRAWAEQIHLPGSLDGGSQFRRCAASSRWNVWKEQNSVGRRIAANAGAVSAHRSPMRQRNERTMNTFRQNRPKPAPSDPRFRVEGEADLLEIGGRTVGRAG